MLIHFSLHFYICIHFHFIQIKLSTSIPYKNKEITSNAYIKSHPYVIHEIIKNHQYISYICQQCFRVQNHGSISPLIAHRCGPHKEHIKNIKKVLLHNHLSVVPRAITSPSAPVGPRRWTLSSWRWPLWSHHSPTALCPMFLSWLWL